MRKWVGCTAITLVLLSVGMTANAWVPDVDMEAGYGYNTAKDGIHQFHVDVSPTSKVTIGAEARHWNHGGNETDVYGMYRLGQIYVGMGNRNYYDRDAHRYGLVKGKARVLGPVDVYAGVKMSGVEKEYQAGLRMDLVPSSFDVDLNYTYYMRDDVKDEGGVGIGLNYHF